MLHSALIALIAVVPIYGTVPLSAHTPADPAPSRPAPLRSRQEDSLVTYDGPSALPGLLVGLEAFRSVAPGGSWKLLSVESRAVRGEAGEPEGIALRFHMECHAASGRLAEAAYSRLQDGIKAHVNTLRPEPREYHDAIDQLVSLPMQSLPAVDATVAGSHRAVAEVTIPAAALGTYAGGARQGLASDKPDDADAMDPSALSPAEAQGRITSFVGALAVHKNVALGRVCVSSIERGPAATGPHSWSIRPVPAPEGDGRPEPAQVLLLTNLLHLLQIESHSIAMTHLTLRAAASPHAPVYAIEVAVRPR